MLDHHKDEVFAKILEETSTWRAESRQKHSAAEDDHEPAAIGTELDQLPTGNLYTPPAMELMQPSA